MVRPRRDAPMYYLLSASHGSEVAVQLNNKHVPSGPNGMELALNLVRSRRLESRLWCALCSNVRYRGTLTPSSQRAKV